MYFFSFLSFLCLFCFSSGPEILKSIQSYKNIFIKKTKKKSITQLTLELQWSFQWCMRGESLWYDSGFRAAQCCSAGAQLLSKTHPRLGEAKSALMVLQVLLLLLPGLLELLPQPLYPVMVTGGDLPDATERNSQWGRGRCEISQKASHIKVPLELAGVTKPFSHISNSHIPFQSLLNIVDLAVVICTFTLHPGYFLSITLTESIPCGQLGLIHVAFRLQKNAGLLWSAIIKHSGKPSFTSPSLRAFERPVNRNQ